MVMVLVAKLLELLGLQEYETADPNDAEEMVESDDYYVVDVRGRSDEQIPGTDETVSMREIDELADGLRDTEKEGVVVYCRSGMRSAGAARSLSKKGYDAVSLKGGIKGWKGSGRRVE